MTAGTVEFPILESKSDLENGSILAPRFGADGLLTCVTQDADTGVVLMVGHMNADAFALTIQTGEGWYWSRSRGQLWHKGATSGNVQRIEEILIDCDQDAIVLRVRVDGHGATCHTGRVSCFYRRVPLGQSVADGALFLEEAGDPPRFDPEEVYGRG